ncbi:dTDP-4-dehydrorhamnose reductase [Fictibacillus halophilus]|uniref:dTDP-4-dehydrorhamnose reductase n=1 Tax=Fictibacillus halophilus TaxID=1610490 RepID=A0ABV2LES6_9BACL
MILRTGPLYADNENHIIEKRTIQLIEKIKENKPIEAWANVYRTFVNVNDLSSAILELSKIEFNGILHAGPIHKESYYSFFKKRLKQLGWDNSLLFPIKISKEKFPYLSLDTSLNTQKAQQFLRSKFHTV